ncbi:hypothetical protein ANCDUO_20973 [Ancylostoma duodenale]|uniref:SCP domain-containing protein n=1 Tax=Ancylostoma duodenale TaxID=51022 RepID=A0A0C2FQL0_9BILA|nr:hypothetical protein ANCDUO_20973 [Ancylostoma duodenale]
MVWATTEYIGCAIHNCSDKTLVVCNYSTAGNTYGQKIYETGSSCTNCPTGYKCTDEKLCALEEDL